ncbi:hypothetical protein VTK26DRAFT_3686 [Humicola hyalothermophila]
MEALRASDSSDVVLWKQGVGDKLPRRQGSAVDNVIACGFRQLQWDGRTRPSPFARPCLHVIIRFTLFFFHAILACSKQLKNSGPAPHLGKKRKRGSYHDRITRAKFEDRNQSSLRPVTKHHLRLVN